jgi:hypothetical protein
MQYRVLIFLFLDLMTSQCSSTTSQPTKRLSHFIQAIQTPILGKDVEFGGFKTVIHLTVISVPGAAPHFCFCLSHTSGFTILGRDELALFVKTWAELTSPYRRARHQVSGDLRLQPITVGGQLAVIV